MTETSPLDALEQRIATDTMSVEDRARLLRTRDLLVAQGHAEAGRLDDAEILLRDALERQLADAPEDPDLAWFYATLAVVLVRAARYEEALETARAARRVADRLVASDDPIHVTVRDCAGRAALVLGYYEDASLDLDDVLERLGPSDPIREATLAEASARAHFHVGRFDEAGARASRAAARYVDGGSGIGALRARLLAAQCVFQAGDAPAAETLFRETIGALERALGADAFECARPLEALAAILAETGRPAEGWRVARRAVGISRRSGGDDALETADALATAGLVAARWHETGGEDETLARAVASLELSRETYLRRSGVQPDRTVSLVLALMLTEGHEFERAADVLVELAFDEVDSGVVDATRALAARSSAAGDALFACEVMRTLRRTTARALGPTHPATAFVSAGLATLLLEGGRYEEAEREYDRAVVDLEASGFAADAAIDVAINLAILLWRRGEVARAEDRFARAMAWEPDAAATPRRAACLERAALDLAADGATAAARSVAEAWTRLCDRTLGDDDPETARARLARERLEIGSLDE